MGCITEDEQYIALTSVEKVIKLLRLSNMELVTSM